MSDNLPSSDSSQFFSEVREILDQARTHVAQTVNAAMVETYWSIGKKIVEEEQGGSAQATYGAGLLKELSKSLTQEFGQGFSLANLKNFRKFYLTYPEGQKSYALRSLLSWTHHRLIMRRGAYRRTPTRKKYSRIKISTSSDDSTRPNTTR
jgi:hypothetical protein